MSENMEDLIEIFECNRDVEFEYNGKTYFLAPYIYELPNTYKRCLRNGLKGEVIMQIEDEDYSLDGFKIDGKIMRGIADEITYMSILTAKFNFSWSELRSLLQS